jgi:hypothetical protein
VQLTLLLDQGEDAPGPRWQRGSQPLHDLGEVLAQVSEPAVVVLGPPGSGKSTLLWHYELDCARMALAGQAGDDLCTTPLTFFISLADYKPASANAPCRSPKTGSRRSGPPTVRPAPWPCQGSTSCCGSGA